MCVRKFVNSAEFGKLVFYSSIGVSLMLLPGIIAWRLFVPQEQVPDWMKRPM